MQRPLTEIGPGVRGLQARYSRAESNRILFVEIPDGLELPSRRS